MSSFAALSLADELNRAISDSGYTAPTPIQTRMIPIITEGRDIIGLSQTGTGKTAAFVLPILDKLATSKQRARRGSCTVLVLSPTRELSNQIADTVRRYGKYVNYNQAIIVGGVSYPPQIRALERGTDIVIATPGRVLDHIESGVMSLKETTIFVLDEADQMLDFGFLPVIKQILNTIPKNRQMILLSATMPKAIQELTKEFMKNPEFVEATPESRPVDKIKQHVIYVEKSRKNMALLEILSQKDAERSIVFTRTKFGADRVQKFLNNYGIFAVSLHGNKSQGQRQRALGQFRSGEATVLVATDIAGRGIDIDDVSHVINVDLPNIPESYVHRIGRTARAGRAGIAISFCSKAERQFLRDIERLIGAKIEKRDDQPGVLKAATLSDTPVNLDGAANTKNQGSRNQGGRGRGSGRSDAGGRDKPRGSNGGASRGPKKPFKKSFGSDARSRDAHSRDDRPRDDNKPNRNDRPRDAHSRDDRPRDDNKPNRNDRPRDAHSRDDRPRDGRPNRNDRLRDDRPNRDARSRDDKPRGDRKPSTKTSVKPFARSGVKPSARPKSGAPKSGRPKSSGSKSGKLKSVGRSFSGTAEQGLKRKARVV